MVRVPLYHKPVGSLSQRRIPRPRLLLALGCALVLLGVGAWWALAQRSPGEISGSSTEEFIAASTTGPAAVPSAAPMDWPTYGFDPARSHTNSGLAHHPPFRQRWLFHAMSLLEFPPSAADGRLFFGQLRGRFFAVDTKTGKRIWTHPTGNCSAASPTIVGKVVYAAFLAKYPCPKGEPGAEGFVVAWAAATGKRIWGVKLPPVESSPLVVNGVVYVGAWDGAVYALDAKTGAIRWKTMTDAQIVSSAAWVDAKQAGGRPAIAIGTNGGSIYELDAATGAVRWQGQSLARLGSGREYFYATPTVANGRVFAANTDGWLYAFGAKTGRLLWAKAAGTYVYTAPVVAANVVYVGTYDGFVVAYDSGTGQQLWRVSVPGAVHGAPVLMDGLLYFSTCAGCGQNGVRYAKSGPDGSYAIDITTHKIVWRFPDGKYSPLVADDQQVYLIGAGVIRAMVPTG